MVWNRSSAGSFNLNMLLGLITLAFTIKISMGITNPNDVAAINSLYLALGSPSLPGWVASGGDPCGGPWQGVVCENSSISSLTLNGANLRGNLGSSLGRFSSIETIMLSNNHIGGSIPSELPATLINLFLSDNKLTGSIPSSLSSLVRLSAMSLNNNGLTGEIPDTWGGLKALINLDLSSNNLRGQLPPSMKNLLALTSFHLQNNNLSGTLDVLQDLPLKDLDVHNNSFSGPIPPKLLAIPKFRRDGNPFNTVIVQSPPPTPTVAKTAPTPAPAPKRALPVSPGPSTPQKPPSLPPEKRADAPSPAKESNSNRSRKSSRTKRVAWISVAVSSSFILLICAVMLCMQKCSKKRRVAYRATKQREITPYTGAIENSRDGTPAVLPSHGNEKGRVGGLMPNPRNEAAVAKQQATVALLNNTYDMNKLDLNVLAAPPPLPPPQVIVSRSEPKTFVRAYTIASLQEYTNSFSPECLIGGGMLGNVYRAELPNGKLLAIKKLDKKVANKLKDDRFMDFVYSIDRIRHANVIELTGYCSEHGERLLVYEFCRNGTLQDALDCGIEFKKELSWNMRIRIALGAAKALAYLHEILEPPVIHGNFSSANILLDDEFGVLVSDCGLAPLMLSRSLSQLSGQLLTTCGYGASNFESEIHTPMGDVYSFGVVMLELFTGRMSYDRSQARGEQFLVRWAVPQLHDIDALSRMVDPVLGGKYSVKSLSHFADIISRCVMVDPEFRPRMSEVTQDLMHLLRKEPPGRLDRG